MKHRIYKDHLAERKSLVQHDRHLNCSADWLGESNCSVHKPLRLLHLTGVFRGARPRWGRHVAPGLLRSAVHSRTCFLNSALGWAHGIQSPSSHCSPLHFGPEKEVFSPPPPPSSPSLLMNIWFISELGKDSFWLLWDGLCFLIYCVSISPWDEEKSEYLPFIER